MSKKLFKGLLTAIDSVSSLFFLGKGQTLIFLRKAAFAETEGGNSIEGKKGGMESAFSSQLVLEEMF